MSDAGGPLGGFPAPPAWSSAPPPASAPAPHRRRVWPWMLAGVLALIIGLAITGGTVFVQKVKPVIDAANQFLGDLDDGNLASAHDQLCSRDREVIDDQLLGVLEADDYDVNPFDVSINGSRATVGFDVAGLRRNEKLELPLRKEAGTWRPCLTDGRAFSDLGDLELR